MITNNMNARPERGALPRRSGLRSMLHLIRPQRAWFALALALTVIGAALTLVQPLASKALIDRVGAGEPIMAVIGLVLALFLVAALVEALAQYSLERVSERVARQLRLGLARRTIRARISSVREFSTGDLLSRATADVGMVRDMLATSLVQMFSVALYGIGTTVVMAVLDTTMLLIMVGTVIVAATLVGSVLIAIRTVTERAQASLGRFASSLERVLGSLRTVKAYLAETQELDRLERDVDEAYRNGLRAARLGAIVSPAVEFAVNGALLVVLVVGGAQVASGQLEVGSLVAFLLYATYLVMPLAGLFSALSIMQRGLAGLQRVEETRRLEPEIGSADESSAGMRAPGVAGRLRFSEVSYRYPASGRGITGISFELPRTGIVAIVGPSGVGKSTVLDLIERFIEPDQGEIWAGTSPLEDISLKRWRGCIALVDQEAPVFDGTIRENLLYGHAAGTEDEVLAAVRGAGLEELIASLPDALDTRVGERGRSLSGGERQRLALARAWMVPSRIVLLDEPTSHLDAYITARILESILQLGRTRLVLVVAHDDDVIEIAQQVIRLSEPPTAPSAATPPS